MREIQLTKGYTALVSDEDYDRVNEFKWCAKEDRRKDGTINAVYAARNVSRKDGSRMTQRLHRRILDVTDPKVQVDHRNHNGLDCQRHNLRVATQIQNSRNRRKQTGSSSKCKGVRLHSCGNWQSRIQVNGKLIHLGLFDSEVAAAKQYDAAARQYFGDFAPCNCPIQELAKAA
jgi:hypothetical protein